MSYACLEGPYIAPRRPNPGLGHYWAITVPLAWKVHGVGRGTKRLIQCGCRALTALLRMKCSARIRIHDSPGGSSQASTFGDSGRTPRPSQKAAIEVRTAPPRKKQNDLDAVPPGTSAGPPTGRPAARRPTHIHGRTPPWRHAPGHHRGLQRLLPQALHPTPRPRRSRRGTNRDLSKVTDLMSGYDLTCRLMYDLTCRSRRVDHRMGSLLRRRG